MSVMHMKCNVTLLAVGMVLRHKSYSYVQRKENLEKKRNSANSWGFGEHSGHNFYMGMQNGSKLEVL